MTDKNELLQHDETFRYTLLGRLQRDCEYYLGYGNRQDKHLWASNVEDQIDTMITLYESFDDAAGMIGGLDFDLVSVMTTSYKGDTDSYNKRFDPRYVHLDASDGMKKESHAFIYDLYYFNLQKIDYQIIGQLETEAFNRVLDVIDEFDREGLLRVVKTNL